MAKELLLYSGIYSYTAAEIIKALEEYKSDEVTLRVNSGGGDTGATWGLVAKIIEHGNVTIKVDGVAFSGAANLLMYANKVESLDVSTFMFHRAAYDYGGNSPEEQALLLKVNSDLRKKMEAKIDSDTLKAMKGVTVAELFEKEERLHLFFTSAEMKKLGIVSKINTIDPAEVKAFNEMYMRVAAEHNVPPPQPSPIIMTTLAELKEKFPAIYAMAIEAGKTEGIAAEKDRVGAAMVFAHLDPEGVKKIIESGKAMTATQMAEFSLKAASPAALSKLKDASQKDIKTDEEVAVLTAEQKQQLEVDTFQKGIRAAMGLDKVVGGPSARIVLATA